MRVVKDMFIPALCTVALSTLLPLGAIADGLMRNGHVAGPHTTLVLTREQREQLRKGAYKISLTPDQQQTMRASTGVTGVTKVSVLPKTTRTCTCELEDVSARISAKTIEVADSQFGRRFDRFRYNYAYWAKINGAENKEDALKAPSKAIILRKEASKLGPDEVNRASELLKRAIAINPEYTLARQLLALNYTDYSHGKESLIQRKSKYEEAIALVRGRDAELEQHLSYQLHLINEMIDAKKELTEFDTSTVLKPLLKYW